VKQIRQTAQSNLMLLKLCKEEVFQYYNKH